MTSNRFSLINSLFALALTVFSQAASASQAKAQLFLPWPMLNAKLGSVLNQSNTGFATKVPTLSINADGIVWSLTNINYAATANSLSSQISSTEANISSNSTVFTVDIEKLSVDQTIQQNEGGVIVNVHLKADCGPITLTQPSAQISSIFNIDWSSGSPEAILRSSSLSWAPDSWVVSPFTCVGPGGLNEVLRTQIADRLKNAGDFKPYLDQFLISESKTLVEGVLGKIRQPFTITAGSTTQIFQVGALFNLPQGVIADLTVSDFANAPLLPAMALPADATLNALSKTTPSLIAGKDLIEQIIQDELNTQASSYKNDLQNDPTFHAIMHDRLKQVLGWIDLIHYFEDSSFPLTLFKPKFQGLTVLKNGTLETTVNLNGMVQSYREHNWWRWLVIGGDTKADVTTSVKAGKIFYNTSLIPETTSINYSDEYKKAFGKEKDAAPPAKKIIDALSGQQPKLSGSFVFPVVDVADTAKYRLSGIHWINSNKFFLSFTEL